MPKYKIARKMVSNYSPKRLIVLKKKFVDCFSSCLMSNPFAGGLVSSNEKGPEPMKNFVY